MQWSPQQDAALKTIDAWVRDPQSAQRRQILKFAGFAGVGKTTLAKTAAAGARGRVLFLAPTGKAADVLTRKGCPAKTIHSTAYVPKGEKRTEAADAVREDLAKELEKPSPDEGRVRHLRKHLRQLTRNDGPIFAFNPEGEISKPDVDLIVVDEGSMVDDDTRVDLLSYGKKILVLYDPFQLPPVRGYGAWTDGKPDILLTEIHRQAADSGILRFATAIRSGDPLPAGRWGDDCEVYAQGSEPFDRHTAALGSDQVLCGRNETRIMMNRVYRAKRGFDPRAPSVGDRVICLRNEYDHQPVLLNGSTWTVLEADEPDVENMTVWLSVESRDVVGLRAEIQSHLHMFWGQDDVPPWKARDYVKMDYAHAITVHKSQGSEWGSVYVHDESISAFPAHPKRHLYTAATRARDKLIVIRP